MKEKRILILILGAFVVLGIGYAILTPVFEASDELWHYPMVQTLANGGPLPIQVFDPELAGPWKQEASQPPLYYYLGAAFTFWIDTSDMDGLRWLNPHVDTGVITSDGNINLVIHDPDVNPWQGTLLAVRTVRIFSVFLGTVTVYLTYLIAKEVAPDRPEIALGAAAVNAFTPMFLFISASVNNDNLVIVLSSLALLLMIRLVRSRDSSLMRESLRLLVLGIVIGLGALTKISAIGLLFLALLSLFINRWVYLGRDTSLSGMARALWQTTGRFLVLLIPVLLIAGWWYFRNLELYGDWSGWNAFIAVLGKRAHPASLAQLWDERWGFMLSYWGLFGGLNVSMPDWIYRLLNAVVIISFVGFFIYLGNLVISWFSSKRMPISDFKSLTFNLLTFAERNIALILCILWGLAIILGLIRWATVTWSSQGRLVFSSISAFSTLLALGLVGWLPQRPARVVMAFLALFLFSISAIAPLLWISPAYMETKEEVIDLRIVNETYGDRIELISYSINKSNLTPGDELQVALKWKTLANMDRDWSVFVHLNDPVLNNPIAQRDMYPGHGLLATSLLEPDREIINRYSLRIPDTALGASELDLSVGLYDLNNGERLKTRDGFDNVVLTQVSLEPSEGRLPNPIQVNFENELELVGFRIGPRIIEPSGDVELELFWRPLDALDEDYTFFAQLVDEDTTRWAGQDLQLPTSSWPSDEVQSVKMILRVSEDTPPDVYPIIIGSYTRSDDGSFDRLQRVTEDGRLTDDFLSLTDLRVTEMNKG